MIDDPQERSTWRSGGDVLCVQLAFFWKGGALMWLMPLHLHVNQKFDYDDYDVDMRVFSLGQYIVRT